MDEDADKMTLDDIEDTANPAPEEQGVEVEEEEAAWKTFRIGFFRARFKVEKIEQLKNMDPVGRKLAVSEAVRVNKKKMKNEGLLSVPNGSYDEAREKITDAVSEW